MSMTRNKELLARWVAIISSHKKKSIFICATFVAVCTWCFYFHLSDNKALEKANQFLAKIEPNTSFSCQTSQYQGKDDPILIRVISYFLKLAEPKTVVCRSTSKGKVVLRFGSDKEIDYYSSGILDKGYKKYWYKKPYPPVALSSDSPSDLEERAARAKFLEYAQEFNIPKDFELSEVKLDLGNVRTWRAKWIRKLNGFPFQDDYIAICIMALDGEMWVYGQKRSGTPCPTEVKVSKEDAISKGWDVLARLQLFNLSGDALKKQYPLSSTELQIVQPNAVLGWIVPFWKMNRSRLAWVLTYDLNCDGGSEQYDRVLKAHGDHARFVIEIDAATKNFLGGSNETTYNP